MGVTAAISVSYCGSHHKGGDPGSAGTIPGHLHAAMLARTVNYLHSEVDWPVIVCATAFPGILCVDTSAAAPEREYLWDVFRTTKIVSVADNPGHQRGANWSIRMGIEAASKLGIDYLVHTAEDVVPHSGIMAAMVAQMERERSDYCGEQWGVHKDELNAQFFACRVAWFATYFDGAGIGGEWTEKYLAKLVHGHKRRTSLIERVYGHTHDPEEHERMVRAARFKGEKTHA